LWGKTEIRILRSIYFVPFF